MGVIEDVYEDIETDVSFERFEEAVTDKVEKMGGLTDEETAAELIKHELKDQEVGSIADIEPGMDEVKFLGKILSIGETRTFERDDDEDADGKVCNVELADASGNVRAALWDKMADSATEQLDVGDVLRVKGRPKEGFNGLEVSVDQAEPELDADVDVKIQDTYTVEELSLGLSDVNLMATVLETEQVRTFDRDDGSEGRVSNLVVGDETDRVRVTLWDGMADRATELDTDTSIEVSTATSASGTAVWNCTWASGAP
jgi:Single-stranded DNA-binding replication protein A (RPA), large (70 kD) subunit and related ssDNA-binding proteins